MSIFSDLDNEFRFLDYLPSHNQLLIRSLNNQDRDYNIDIIFKGVSSLLILTYLNGIEIDLFELNQNKFLIEDYKFKEDKNYRIFSIKDNDGKTYFINAMCFGVFHNQLDILETSIGRYDWGDLGEKILWYAE